MRWRLYRMDLERKIAVGNLALPAIVLVVFLATFRDGGLHTATEAERIVHGGVTIAMAILTFPVGWFPAFLGSSGASVALVVFVPLNAYLWGYAAAAFIRLLKRRRLARQDNEDLSPHDDATDRADV